MPRRKSNARQSLNKDDFLFLFERDENIAKLHEVYDENREKSTAAVASGGGPKQTSVFKNHMVLLVGQAGNGKSTLAKTLIPRVQQDDGYFLIGKFDDLEHPEPFAPFVTATNKLIQQAMAKGPAELKRIRKAVTSVMDPQELNVLTKMIPSLEPIVSTNNAPTSTIESSSSSVGGNNTISTESTTSSVTSNDSSSAPSKGAKGSPDGNSESAQEGKSSFLVTYCNFMRSICTPAHPTVLVLDNSQYSDAGSLEVLKVLVSDTKLQGLLCVVAFRQVGVRHPFSFALRHLETAGVVQFTPILPTPLSADSIVNWLQHQYPNIGPDAAKLREAAQLIQQQTQGHVLSIVLYLKLLEMEDIIYKDDSKGGQWMYARDEFQNVPLGGAGDVFKVFPQVFGTLSNTSQKICMVAACMGQVLDPGVLSQLLPPNSPISEALEEANRKGIVVPVPTGIGEMSTTSLQGLAEASASSTVYMFAHSTFRDCIYKLIPGPDKQFYHATIGQYIYLPAYQKEAKNAMKNANNNNNNNGSNSIQKSVNMTLYHVIAQMHRGIDRLSSNAKDILAKLCLQAGNQVRNWTDHTAAAKYLDLAIKLLSLNKDPWKSHYSITLSAYNASAKVAHEAGNTEAMESRLNAVLDHAKTLSDKLDAYCTQIDSLSAGQAMHADAISLGLKVLGKLGESITTKRTSAANEHDVKAVLSTFDAKDDAAILKLGLKSFDGNMAKQRDKLGAMRIYNLLVSPSFLVQSDMIPMIASRMVHISLKYGLMETSAVGFVILGTVLCSYGQTDKGHRCGRIALQILEQMEDNQWNGRVKAIYWGIISPYTTPWKKCQEPLKIAYRLCMEAGDSEFAVISPVLSVLNMIVAGGSLGTVAEAMKPVYKVLYQKQQDTLMRIIRPFFQMLLNLMGASRETNPLILTGNVMNEEEDIRFAQSTGNSKVLFCIYLCQCELAYYLHKFSRARDCIKKCIELDTADTILSTLSVKLYFLDAMTTIALAWESERGKDTNETKVKLKRAYAALEKLEDLATRAPENFRQKVYLITAELKALEGGIDEAMTLFKKAIEHAEQNGATSDKTLACERAGLALRFHQREDPALDYLEDCCAYYRELGALVKVNHVKGNVIPQAIYDWEG